MGGGILNFPIPAVDDHVEMNYTAASCWVYDPLESQLEA
jgi:hypothetical protein